jgi:hypothetical protein
MHVPEAVKDPQRDLVYAPPLDHRGAPAVNFGTP